MVHFESLPPITVSCLSRPDEQRTVGRCETKES
jgi:hypothetical protein